jgi:hypothetical protein
MRTAKTYLCRRYLWHVKCKHENRTARMATKANIMKLLQEVRGFDGLSDRTPQNRPIGPLMLQFRNPSSRHSPLKRKRILRIDMQNLPDIPHPVPIVHRTSQSAS